MLKFFFWASLTTIWVIWIGYPAMLFLLAAIFGTRRPRPVYVSGQSDWPAVTVIIPAYNEESNIVSRINNLLEQDYPGPLEIFVGSDGSDDRTNEVVAQLQHPLVRLAGFPVKRGRAAVHNDCVKDARGDIVVFTDAETHFEKNFLQKIVAPFRDPEVGATVGRLAYSNPSESFITESATRYWDYEARLRQAESTLGIFAFGSGACMSVRKNLYRELALTEDVEYASTIDVVKQGYKIIFVSDAIAYDVIAKQTLKTFRNRVRQTSKNFKSIGGRLISQQILQKPMVFLDILFHKTLRHLTPFFLILLLGSNILLFNESYFYILTLFGQLGFYCSAIIGLTCQGKFKIPKIVNYAATFLVLNAGRFIGVVKALFGEIPKTY